MLTTVAFQRGEVGEQRVLELLRARGWWIVPTFDMDRGSQEVFPHLLAPAGEEQMLPLPDLDCCRGGARVWVEVKTKEAPTWTRKTRQWEHGIHASSWESYLKIQRITGCPVLIAIVEENTGAVLLQSLAALGKARLGRMWQDGQYLLMAYWPRAAFYTLDEGSKAA